MPRSPFRRALLCWLFASGAACSTPISPYSQFDDEADEDEDPAPPSPTEIDAGRGRDGGAIPIGRDAGVSPVGRDAGVSPVGRDAGVSPVGRDAGVSPPAPRDAGGPVARDAGAPRDAGGGITTNCMRVPNANFASLLSDGCTRRPTITCAGSTQAAQQIVNDYLSLLAEKCGSPAGVSIGVVFGNDGCPTLLGYQGAGVQGNVSQCLQSVIENSRIGCSLTCALIGPAAR